METQRSLLFPCLSLFPSPCPSKKSGTNKWLSSLLSNGCFCLLFLVNFFSQPSNLYLLNFLFLSLFFSFSFLPSPFSFLYRSVLASVEYTVHSCCLVAVGKEGEEEGSHSHALFPFVFVEMRMWAIPKLLKLVEV